MRLGHFAYLRVYGADYLVATFEEIAMAMGYESALEAADGFEKMLGRLSLSYPEESEKEGKAKYFDM